jgi:phosphate transport system permease protein
MPHDRRLRLRAIDGLMSALCALATLCAVVSLLAVLGYVVGRGVGGLSWSFFTALPKPVGESGGGMANALLGTLILVGLASLISVPLGVLGGIYLAEYGHRRFARLVRFVADVMTGVPSIVVGIVVYMLLVLSMRRFSALAGGVALAILMLPVVTRSTEELVKLVPESLREAAMALGTARWRVTAKVVLPIAAPGIATGIMLAIARAAGETAPLLFTALSSRFFSDGLDRPIASLPVQIFTYAVAPYPDWQQQAWTGALVLVGLVLVLNLAARRLTRHRVRAG